MKEIIKNFSFNYGLERLLDAAARLTEEDIEKLLQDEDMAILMPVFVKLTREKANTFIKERDAERFEQKVNKFLSKKDYKHTYKNISDTSVDFIEDSRGNVISIDRKAKASPKKVTLEPSSKIPKSIVSVIDDDIVDFMMNTINGKSSPVDDDLMERVIDHIENQPIFNDYAFTLDSEDNIRFFKLESVVGRSLSAASFMYNINSNKAILFKSEDWTNFYHKHHRNIVFNDISDEEYVCGDFNYTIVYPFL